VRREEGSLAASPMAPASRALGELAWLLAALASGVPGLYQLCQSQSSVAGPPHVCSGTGRRPAGPLPPAAAAPPRRPSPCTRPHGGSGWSRVAQGEGLHTAAADPRLPSRPCPCCSQDGRPCRTTHPDPSGMVPRHWLQSSKVWGCDVSVISLGLAVRELGLLEALREEEGGGEGARAWTKARMSHSLRLQQLSRCSSSTCGAKARLCRRTEEPGERGWLGASTREK